MQLDLTDRQSRNRGTVTTTQVPQQTADLRVFGRTLPILTTARCVLRPPRLADADAIAESLADRAVARMLTAVPSPYFRQDAADWLRRLPNGVGAGTFAFAVTLNGKAIGIVGFDRRGDALHFGYWLDRAHWRHGLMSEAADIVLAWYFAAAPETVLRSSVFTDNPASLALQHKLGFVETGIGEAFSLARNSSHAHVETILDAARFHRARAAAAKPPEQGNSLTLPGTAYIDAAQPTGQCSAREAAVHVGCSP